MARTTESKEKPSKIVRKSPKIMAAKKKPSVKVGAKKVAEKKATLPLAKELLLKMHRLMAESRVLEERLIKIYKMGYAFFWIGGPGEEGFGVPLGLLVDKGQGIRHDWLHLHYRATPTLIAMGMPMVDGLRLIMNKATDVSTGGRNFAGHYCYPKWNVAPITSPIEVQYQFAIGTAWAQRRHQSKGVTIVSGGDAGTAEGDFASCLIWASRPGNELPMLITVQNNKWGISTSYDGQHGEQHIADRGKAFGIRTRVINGNDPVESYRALEEELYYIRRNRKPVLLETRVSRLYGHSSASGANFVTNEVDCLKEFESKLLKWGLISEREIKKTYDDFDQETLRLLEQVRSEPDPQAETVWDHVYANNENANWRKF